MIHRFISFGELPELSTEPGDPTHNIPEVQAAMPVEIYWEVEETIRQMRYARVSGVSSAKLWSRFTKLIYPCILTEGDRTWFLKNMGH